MLGSLRDDESEFGKMAAQGNDHLRTLTSKEVSSTKQNSCRLRPRS